MMSNEKLELLATIEELETELATANGLLDEVFEEASLFAGPGSDTMSESLEEIRRLAKRREVDHE